MYPEMFVTNAKVVYNVEDGSNTVEVTTDRFRPGTGWNSHTDFVYTTPKGDWTELKFMRRENVRYIDFLNTMVDKTLEVSRKMAHLSVRQVLDDYPVRYPGLVDLINYLPILDPTFVPPDFNLRCRWQRELLTNMCNQWLYMVISTCRNQVRLTSFWKQVSGLS
jgi:hypothetical protein